MEQADGPTGTHTAVGDAFPGAVDWIIQPLHPVFFSSKAEEAQCPPGSGCHVSDG